MQKWIAFLVTVCAISAAKGMYNNMLCFVFAALIVALDQFFKRWVMRTLQLGETGQELIPGVIGLTRWENDGAMLNILSGQQWLLAGIAFIAAIVLVMILLRYNEGFWGTLGLAAVLGGTVGNLVDRIFNDGKVVDMFRTLFMDFPIFNIADIFITLGFITFLIHFIMITVKAEGREKAASDDAEDEYYDEYDEQEYDDDPDDEQEYEEFREIDSAVAAQSELDVNPDARYSSQMQYEEQSQYAEQTPYDEQSAYGEYKPYEEPDPYGDPAEHETPAVPEYPAAAAPYTEEQYYPETDMTGDYEPLSDLVSDTTFSLDALEMELGSLDDYNVDDLLREYGFEDDESL
jgi:signal peptidase II